MNRRSPFDAPDKSAIMELPRLNVLPAAEVSMKVRLDTRKYISELVLKF